MRHITSSMWQFVIQGRKVFEVREVKKKPGEINKQKKLFYLNHCNRCERRSAHNIKNKKKTKEQNR